MSKIKCIERALQFMESNLKRRISLEDIADAANLSQWYFHRSFRILTGYCVNDYLRRRRICEASHELVYSSKSIRQIAIDYQFESQEAFTRSFSGICGISPGRFRKLLHQVSLFPAISLDRSYQHLRKGEKMLSPKLEKMDAFRVVGVQTQSSPSGTLHKLWADFTQRHGSMEKMHQTYEYIFGVWLAENGYQMAEADSLEIYDERFNPEGADSVFEICIPIIKA